MIPNPPGTPGPGTLEIGQSPLRTAAIGLLGLPLTGLAVALAVAPGMGVVERVLFGLIAVFFGACMIVIFWRLARLRGPVVTLSPEGLRDVRFAAEFIPWDRVRSISTWSHSGQKILILELPDEAFSSLSLTRMARATRKANRLLGADGAAVASQGLRIGHDALVRAAQDYRAAYGAPSPPSGA